MNRLADRFEGLGLVRDREGDEEAEARGVDVRRGNLEIAGEVHLTHRPEEIDEATFLQDVGGDAAADSAQSGSTSSDTIADVMAHAPKAAHFGGTGSS